MKKLLLFTFLSAVVGFAWLSLPSPNQAQAPGTPQQAATGRGLVVGIDKEKGVVTISHEPLRELNMMAMTMSYAIKDKSQLANLQPMQKVEFQVVYDGNDYLITEIK